MTTKLGAHAHPRDEETSPEIRAGLIVTVMGDPQRGRRYLLVESAQPDVWLAAPVDGRPAHRIFVGAAGQFVAIVRDSHIRVVDVSSQAS